MENKFLDTTFTLIFALFAPNRPFSTAAERTDARILKAPILGFTLYHGKPIAGRAGANSGIGPSAAMMCTKRIH